MGRPARKVKKIRLNLDLPPSAKARLEAIRDTTEADSMSVVVGRALAVYERLLEVQKATGAVLLKDGDGSLRELMLVP